MNLFRKITRYLPVYILIGFVNINDLACRVFNTYIGRVFIGVGVAILIDLMLGVRKAKKSGIFEGSYGLSRTIDKFIKYYSLILLGVIADEFLSPAGLTVPWVTMGAGLLLLGIEIWSWFEKAEKKEQKKIKQMAWLLKNNREVAKEMYNTLKEMESNSNSNDNE